MIFIFSYQFFASFLKSKVIALPTIAIALAMVLQEQKDKKRTTFAPRLVIALQSKFSNFYRFYRLLFFIALHIVFTISNNAIQLLKLTQKRAITLQVAIEKSKIINLKTTWVFRILGAPIIVSPTLTKSQEVTRIIIGV